MCLLLPPGYSKRDERDSVQYWVNVRLIWVLAGHTGLIVGCVVRWLCHNILLHSSSSGPHSTAGSASDYISKFESQLDRITFMEIDHKIIKTVILPLSLIQEEQLPVTGESMCSKYWLTALRTKPRKSLCKLNDWLGLILTALTGP